MLVCTRIISCAQWGHSEPKHDGYNPNIEFKKVVKASFSHLKVKTSEFENFLKIILHFELTIKEIF